MLSRSSARSATSSGVFAFAAAKHCLPRDIQRVLSGDGRRARVIELVIKRMVGVAVISSLRRFDRLVAKSGEDEAIRLVEK